MYIFKELAIKKHYFSLHALQFQTTIKALKGINFKCIYVYYIKSLQITKTNYICV